MARRTAVAVVASLVLVLALGACSSDDDHDMGDMGSDSSDAPTMDGMNGTDQGAEIPDGADFNEADVGFAQGMIVHHEQAVVMAERALDTSEDAEVIALAEKIIAAQDPEIQTMTNWLTQWDQDLPDSNMDHDDHAMGMMSESDMQELERVSGSEFDRRFLEMMIVHHQGAIEMADHLLAEGTYPPGQELAGDIIATQQAEIDEMRDLLDGLAS